MHPFVAFHYVDYPIILRPHSRYPLHKFALLRDAVVREGLFPPSQVFSGEPTHENALLLAHTAEYVRSVRDNGLSDRSLREMGFVWSENLYRRGAAIAGSTLSNAEAALSSGLSFTLGGGAHHAFSDRGRGFCIFNDVAITALSLLKSGRVQRCAVLDCDVHQGDGTASILQAEPRAFTCSVHGAKNYPFRKESSDLDVELDDHCNDETYLAATDRALSATLNTDPELLLYIAGADPLKDDTLGRLDVSAEALKERDRRVFQACFDRRLPVSVVFGGGYCDPIDQTVAMNVESIRTAIEIYS